MRRVEDPLSSRPCGRRMIGLPLLAALSMSPSAFGRAPGDGADVGDLVRQGDSYFRTGRYREALAVYEKARSLDPGDVGLLLSTARGRRALYDPSSVDPSNVRLITKAIEDYEAYLAQVPDDNLAFRALAGAWVEAGQEGAALLYLRERHAGRPSDVETIDVLADFTEKKGDYEESEALLRKRIALEPSNPEAYYRFGVSAYTRSASSSELQMEPGKRRKVIDDGVAQLDRAIALRPDYYEAMLYEGMLCREYLKVEPDAAKQARLKAKAEEWQKKALETRRRITAKAGQPE